MTVNPATSTNTKPLASGKTRAPLVPAPKKLEGADKSKDEVKDKKTKPVVVAAVEPMVVLKPNKKKDDLDEESDSDDVEDPVTTEVPGGEKEIGEEVLRFTKDAHNKRVDLVKTKATLEYEIKTIRTTIIRYKTEIKKTTEIVTTTRTEITEETSKLESLKTSSISATLKE